MSEPAVILIVDDQPDLLEGIALTLESSGHEVRTAPDGLAALDILQEESIDLIVADIAMPRMNGYQLYARVRENDDWLHIPFIFLTARALDSDVRYGKELGADDYLTKPIEPDDLIAAVNGKLARARQLAKRAPTLSARAAAQSRQLQIGKLTIEPSSHRVWLADEPVTLSAREFILLELLAQHAEEVVSAQALVLATHDLKTDAEEAGSLIRPLIRSVRRKLGAPIGETGLIETVRGVGYRLVADGD